MVQGSLAGAGERAVKSESLIDANGRVNRQTLKVV